MVLALAILEGGSRILVQAAPNARWEYSRKLDAALGFPALNDLFLPDAQLFWKLKPNLRNNQVSGHYPNTPEIRFAVSTDSAGFRLMPRVHSAPHRVLFLGDSCTFGLGVEDHQTFPALLQQRMEGVQCVNLAVPAYTAYQGRVLLQQLEPDELPDVLVVAYGRNDEAIWDNLSDVEHAVLIEAQRTQLTGQFRFAELLRHVRPSLGLGVPAEQVQRRPRLTDQEFTEQILAIVAWCRERNVEPILVLWPRLHQMARNERFPKQRALTQIARSQGVQLVNLIPLFRDNAEVHPFLDVIHASPAGCELVADALLPALQQTLGNTARRIARP